MITDAEGYLSDTISLPDYASKGKSGGVVYISKKLRKALDELSSKSDRFSYVITSKNGDPMSAQVVTNWFFNLYRSLGFEGCSSHSGRRTAITRWGRNISKFGGSIRDVQKLARHKSLAMTQKYTEVSETACRQIKC